MSETEFFTHRNIDFRRARVERRLYKRNCIHTTLNTPWTTNNPRNPGAATTRIEWATLSKANSWQSVVRGNWTRVVLFSCILGCFLFVICTDFVYLHFHVLFCLSVSVKWLAVKTACEMTYIVSSGALNSTPTNQAWLFTAMFVLNRDCSVHWQHIYFLKCSILKWCLLMYD